MTRKHKTDTDTGAATNVQQTKLIPVFFYFIMFELAPY